MMYRTRYTYSDIVKDESSKPSVEITRHTTTTIAQTHLRNIKITGPVTKETN